MMRSYRILLLSLTIVISSVFFGCDLFVKEINILSDTFDAQGDWNLTAEVDEAEWAPGEGTASATIEDSRLLLQASQQQAYSARAGAYRTLQDTIIEDGTLSNITIKVLIEPAADISGMAEGYIILHYNNISLTARFDHEYSGMLLFTYENGTTSFSIDGVDIDDSRYEFQDDSSGTAREIELYVRANGVDLWHSAYLSIDSIEISFFDR